MFATSKQQAQTVVKELFAKFDVTSPEDKAGFKARLMAHVETIADRDIQALYRRDLSEKYSAFAFPRREQREWKPAQRGKAAARAVRSTSLARLRKAGSRDALGAAVLAGLLRYPREIARHGEALLHARLADPRFDALVDAVEDGAELESGGLATILAARGMAAPAPEEYSGLRFGFLIEQAEEAQARVDLAQAVALLVERPALEAALAQATARFERDLSEGAYAEQQRLLKRKLEFDSRLRQMASARSALHRGGLTTARWRTDGRRRTAGR